MRVRATLRLRNDDMISARKALGWNQFELAKRAKVPPAAVMAFEALDYTRANAEAEAIAITVALKIGSDDVMPPELQGERIESTVERTSDHTAIALPVAPPTVPHTDRLLSAERSEMTRRLIPCLSETEQTVIAKRLQGLTLEQIAQVVGGTKERVRCILNQAHSKMRRMVDEYEDNGTMPGSPGSRPRFTNAQEARPMPYEPATTP